MKVLEITVAQIYINIICICVCVCVCVYVYTYMFVVGQSLSRVWLCDHMDQALLSFRITRSLFKSMSTESVMLSNHFILYCSLLWLSVFPRIRVFPNGSVLCITWPKYRSFSFSISPSNEYSGLISFRIDWFDLLAVQGTPKSLLQHHTLKASVLWGSAFFMVQLYHSYVTTDKVSLTIQTFVSKVMSNMLSRFDIAFLPKLNHLLISWLWSPFAVILQPKKTKTVTISTFSLSIFHEVMGPDVMTLVLWMLSFKPDFSLSSFTFIKRLISSSLLFSIRVVSSAYLKLLIFLLAILISACDSSSLAFHMIYSIYKLNKKGDIIQPCCTLFPIVKNSVFSCLVPIVVSWSAYRFPKRQVRCSGIPNSLRIFHRFCDPHSQRFENSQWSRSKCFSGIPLFSPWSNKCWKFELWFLCFFKTQFAHLEVPASHIAEAWLEGF